jgi:aarF domain-containing kinase
MAFRFSCLAGSLRYSILKPPSTFSATRHSSTWTRTAFFLRSTPNLGRRALWLIPVVGGVTLWLAPEPQSLFPKLLQAKNLIPCPDDTPQPQQIINSPSEVQQSILRRISSLLRNTIWEPIVTAGRFLYLFYLFAPVIVTAPMLLIGRPAEKLHGDRWGAVWWYDLLVLRMERAGPTFIKVRHLFPQFDTRFTCQ